MFMQSQGDSGRILLITNDCLKQLKQYKSFEDKYNSIFTKLCYDPQGIARHSIKGCGTEYKIYENEVSKDLRLCWSYADHVGGSAIVIWALGDHDHVFKRVSRITGDRFKRLRFKDDEPSELYGNNNKPVEVGVSTFAWHGVRPPAFRELNYNQEAKQWIRGKLALSDEQILQAMDGVGTRPQLLSGGGGSGKTTLLIYKLIHLIELGERPILVTYHKKLADYCRTMLHGHPRLDDVMKHIKTFDEVILYLRERMNIEDTAYASPSLAKSKFIGHFPERKREAAWAEFRGMWKGRVDVDHYQELHQEQLRLQSELDRVLKVDINATMQETEVKLTPEVQQEQTQETSKQKLRKKDRRLQRDKEYAARHLNYRNDGKSNKAQDLKVEARKIKLEQQEKEVNLKKRLRSKSNELHEALRSNLVSSHRYSKDMRFLSDQDDIEGAIEKYRIDIQECGGDRFDACIKILMQEEQWHPDHDYNVLLIDEIQDFTQLELQLLSLLVPQPKSWMFAGDENQIVNPSGFKWDRVKEVIWWREQRNQRIAQQNDSHHYSPNYNQQSSIDPLEKEILYLSINYRNPLPVQGLANYILKLKQQNQWTLLSSDLQTELNQRGFKRAVEIEIDHRETNASDHPWTWEPHSLVIEEATKLTKIIHDLLVKVPSLCVILYDENQKQRLKNDLREYFRKQSEHPESLERIYSPLEVKGLEFDLVLSIDQPRPNSEIEGIRDFEYNQLYVTTTRSKVSMIFVWTDALAEERFLKPFNPKTIEHRYTAGDHRENDWLILPCEESRFGLLTQLHNAQDDQDWVEVAYQRYIEGEKAHAAELYHLGRAYDKAAEIYEELGRFEEAARDFKLAELPVDQMRCQAKQHEKKQEGLLAFQYWTEYAQAIPDFEGFWRTYPHVLSHKLGLKSLSMLDLRKQQALMNSLRFSENDALQSLPESKRSELIQQLSQKKRWWTLQTLNPTGLWADKHLCGEAKGASSEKAPLTQLRRLKQSPDFQKLKLIAERPELAIEQLFDYENDQLGSTQTTLSISDLEFLLGVTSHFEHRLPYQNGERHKKLRNLNKQDPFEFPWKQMSRIAQLDTSENVYKLNLQINIKSMSLLTASRLTNRFYSKNRLHQPSYTRKAITLSFDGLYYLFPEIKPIRGLGRTGIFRRHSDLKKTKFTFHTFSPSLERMFHFAGFEPTANRGEEGKYASNALLNLEKIDGFGSKHCIQIFTETESIQQDLKKLIELMPFLRISHSPTRLAAAEKFGELWVDLVYLCSEYFRDGCLTEVISPLDHNLLEILGAQTLESLPNFIQQINQNAYSELLRQLDSSSGHTLNHVRSSQAHILRYLFAIATQAEVLFLRGTWAYFINDRLKNADSVGGFGHVFLKAAHCHWVNLTLVPIYGIVNALEHYQYKRTESEKPALKTLQDQLDQYAEPLEEAEKSLKAASEQLKQAEELYQTTFAQIGIINTENVSLKDLKKQVTLAQELKKHAEQKLKDTLKPIHKLKRSQEDLSQTLERSKLRLEHLKTQQKVSQWLLHSAEVVSEGPQLTDELFTKLKKLNRSALEWSFILFRIGHNELLKLLPLLNSYRKINDLNPMSESDLSFSYRGTPIKRKGYDKLWFDSYQKHHNEFGNVPVTQTSSERTQDLHLPKAHEMLKFAISQAYTPLAMELLDNAFYFKELKQDLEKLPTLDDEALRDIKASLNSLKVTPRGQTLPWIEHVFAMLEGDYNGLVCSELKHWRREVIRGFAHHVSQTTEPESSQKPHLPSMLKNSLIELVCFWDSLTLDQQEAALESLERLDQVWDDPFFKCVNGLFISKDPLLLAQSYEAGEHWVLFSQSARSLFAHYSDHSPNNKTINLLKEASRAFVELAH